MKNQLVQRWHAIIARRPTQHNARFIDHPFGPMLHFGGYYRHIFTRARRGISGALHSQSALARSNSHPRAQFPSAGAGRVVLMAGSYSMGCRRTRSGPEGSSRRWIFPCAVGLPGWSYSLRCRPGFCDRRWVRGFFFFYRTGMMALRGCNG